MTVRKRPWFLGLLGLSACLLGLLAIVSGVWLWRYFRPQPSNLQQTLFQGINYTRSVRHSPRPLVIHVITVDLRTEGLNFLVTPGNSEGDLPLNARTTAEFLQDFDLQLAINGDGFLPWKSNSLLDYYPHSGDPVQAIGISASRGEFYPGVNDQGPTLYLSRTNRARFNFPFGKIYNAISGNLMLVTQGRIEAGIPDEGLAPRTAIAIDKKEKFLLLLVIDGRQPGYSEGATLTELAEIILEYGGHYGMNLDGGGSSTLVKQGRLGQPVVLNSPIDQNIPGRQRPVGNHLGIYAQPLSTP